MMMLSGLQRLQCRRIRPALWDYVAERLSEGPLETVERHLARCAACRRETESLRRAQGLLAACRHAPIPPPRSDWNALRARLQLEGQPRSQGVEPPALHLPRTSTGLIDRQMMERHRPRRHNRWLPSVAASTACAVVLLLVAFGYRALHTTAPALKGGAPQLLAANENKLHGPIKIAAVGTTSKVSRPSGNVNAATDFEASDIEAVDNSVWIHAPETHADAVRTVAVVRRGRSNALHTLVPASIRVRSETKIAYNGRRMHQAHWATGQSHVQDSPHFRPYTPRPEDALPPGGGNEDHYALDSVVPVGNTGAGGGAYLMSSVRPVQYNSNAPY